MPPELNRALAGDDGDEGDSEPPKDAAKDASAK